MASHTEHICSRNEVHVSGEKILKPENVLRLICIFGATYSCKSPYSTLIFIKSQYCFSLTDEQVTELVPATLTTGLFKMIVGVLTTCHTQYTGDRSICIFLFNRTTLQFFVTYLTGALYVHPL